MCELVQTAAFGALGSGEFQPAVVIGNVSASNESVGVIGTGSQVSAAIGHNVSWGNNGGNANVQTGASIVEIGTNHCGTHTTCP
jgi:hypothetical protein